MAAPTNRPSFPYFAPSVVRSLVIAAAVLQPVGFTVAQDAQPIDDRQAERVQQFEQSISEFKQQVESDLASGRIGENEAWARWFNFHYGEFGLKLMNASDNGQLTDDAVTKLWSAVETPEVTQRIKAAVARGDLTEDEGRRHRETFRKTTNPDVFEMLGDFHIFDAADPAYMQAYESFNSEIAARSPEENRREADRLVESYKKAKQAGDVDRMNLLALEIRTILHSFVYDVFDVEVLGHSYVLDAADPRVLTAIERIRSEFAQRSPAENRRHIERLTASFEQALAEKDEKRILMLALEIRFLRNLLENPDPAGDEKTTIND